MRYLATLLAFLLPLQAAALSCAPWYVQNAYAEAAESTDAYVVVQGALVFATSKLPEVDWSNQQDVPKETRIRAAIRGFSLTHGGFIEPFDGAVTLVVQCTGPWCAKPQKGDTLAFLKRVGRGYELWANPCGGFLFAQPTPAMSRAVETCFEGGPCTAPVP